ncbi:putative F-box protein At4g17565 [Carex rostrata]
MPKRKTKIFTKGKTKISTNVERNWSELPQEILHLFSKKLPDVSDFIRFRAVCKRWQLSAPVTDPPPQIPWLLEGRHQCENSILRFYCLSSDKVHTIKCPRSRGAWLEGPACHYLLACHISPKMYLLNPLTNDLIDIPFFSVDGGDRPDYIGPDPIEGGDIVIIRSFNTMAFWRPKADNWVNVNGVGDSNAYYMGQYFSHDDETGFMNVIDFATKKLAYQVAPPKDTDPFLEGSIIIVESGGKILRLFRHYTYDEQLHFDIYCLYFGDGEGKPSWVKITDIGDQMIFLEYSGGLSFCANNFSGFKGNCIYFVKYERYLCRYDIGDGTHEVLPCPFDLMGTWFVPSLV